MGQWRRIGSDGFASRGKRSIAFALPGGGRPARIGDGDRDHVRARRAGEGLRWSVGIKGPQGGTFRLSGMALGVAGFPGDAFWCVPLLTSPTLITDWGDRVIAREDEEV